MLPRDSGGGGGRIVADYVEMRACANRFTDAAHTLGLLGSQVKGHYVPELPPEIVGRVTSELAAIGEAVTSTATPFEQGAKELKIRALWAEIADDGGTLSGLSSTSMRDFVRYMTDGSMLDYATPAQRELAGILVADLYRDHYKEPDRLIELAGIMRSNGHDAQFSGSFIESFGASRYADIPRVIQAMEWGDRLNGIGGPSDSNVDSELARDLGLDGYTYDGDPIELLSSFSMALATATSAGTLSRTTERNLAYDEDSWAVAQLLHEGRFGAEFLRDVFHSGAVAEIGRRSVTEGAYPIGYSPIGGTRGDGIETDQVALIMDALERNPEAAALALSSDVPEEFRIGVYLVDEPDPLKILYEQNRHWDDDAEQLARMYDAGIEYANHNDKLDQAYRMTESLVDLTLHGEEDHDVMTESLARDLAAHHMENMHVSATGGFSTEAQWIDVDGGGPAYDEAYRLMFGKEDMTELLREFSDNDEANETFLAEARDYQAQLILDNTREPAGDSVVWAKQLGGFDGIVMNAYDLEQFEDFDADNTRHKVVFSFLNSVTGAVQSLHPAGAAAGIATGPILSFAESASAPQLDAVVGENDRAREALLGQMHAAIAAGYYENGLLGGEGAPPGDIVENGHLVDFRERLDEETRNALIAWVENNDHLNDVAGGVFGEADQTLDNRNVDTGG